jgi:hypothetical protein
MSSADALQTAVTAVEGARQLTASHWDEIDGPEAVAMAEAICAAKTYLDAALLRTVERIEDTGALRDEGWASTKDFLTHLLGAHKGTGGGLVRTVEQLRELPMVQSALEEGRISLPQARVIASKVQTLPQVPLLRTSVADRLLALGTEGCDASDLANAFDRVVAECDPDAAIVNADKERAKQERGAHSARFLSFSEDGHGGVRLKGYGTVEDVESIRATLMPLSAPVLTEPGSCGGRKPRPGEPHFDQTGESTRVACPDPGCDHDGRDPRDSGARLWDAWVESCDQLRATQTLPRDHGSVPRVIVTMDRDALQQRVVEAGLATPGLSSSGAQLSAGATRRLACDAELIPAVLGSEGQVLDVGRARRLVTPAIWTALIVRDEHCAFPGCSRLPLACDAHHITNWADGGETSLDNMIMLCRHHHVLTHQSPWTVRIDEVTRRPVWDPPPKRRLSDLQGRVTFRRARLPSVA